MTEQFLALLGGRSVLATAESNRNKTTKSRDELLNGELRLLRVVTPFAFIFLNVVFHC